MKHASRAGFTLVEIIAAVVLSALAMAALLPFLDRVFLLAHQPHSQLREALELQSSMEELVCWHTNGLEELRARLGAEGSLYGGRFLVVNNHYVAFAGNAETSVVASNNLLKVTLQNTLGEQVTRLFTVPL